MNTFKIVVVDDEPLITNTLCQILRDAGYCAFAAYEAEGAMMLCKHHSADLLLSDVNMPGINGIELAQQVAREVPSCQIILFSGHVDTAPLLSEARRQGFKIECLAKPVFPELLLSKIQLASRNRPQAATA
ncbi:MAG TPA: response regulator [Terriglobales bacterium]|nr:response regulator [Terriglobales bacterium]